MPMRSFRRMMKMPLLPCVPRHGGNSPDASFAGQQEAFLNVQGFDAVLVMKRMLLLCLTISAISYRVHGDMIIA